MNIKVINKLLLTSEGVQAKYKNSKPHDFFIRQGEIDGACAPYSVCMILILLGLLKRSDLDVYKSHDKRTVKGKLISKFFAQRGLIRDGYHYEEIVKELAVLKNSLYCQQFKQQDEVLDLLDEEIGGDNPVLISVEYSGGAHALVAVGLEYSVNGIKNKILCIDPGFNKPMLTYWNSVIDISHKNAGKYKFTWLNEHRPQQVNIAGG